MTIPRAGDAYFIGRPCMAATPVIGRANTADIPLIEIFSFIFHDISLLYTAARFHALAASLLLKAHMNALQYQLI